MSPTFQEIAPLSLSDRVMNALKHAFFSGQLKPGDAIMERDLACSRLSRTGIHVRNSRNAISP
jgi:DNA-binding GntR family transcriptional regulator